MEGMRALVLVVVLTGCGLPGAPQVGTACDAGAPRECYSESSFAFCDNGKWSTYACADRCTNVQSQICKPKSAVVGEKCPLSWEGSGDCTDSDKSFVALCEAGKWTDHFKCATGTACVVLTGNGTVQCR